MTDVLAERQEIDALIKGRSIAHAFADTVTELGDSPKRIRRPVAMNPSGTPHRKIALITASSICP